MSAPDRETTHYLCTGCPLGCRLEVEHEEGEIVEVRGFSCKRGKTFAVQEFTDPRRSVSTTVRVEGGRWARLPVKTAEQVPKDRVQELCDALHRLTLHAPVRMGDVVVGDAAGTGIAVVATRDMPEGSRDHD